VPQIVLAPGATNTGWKNVPFETQHWIVDQELKNLCGKRSEGYLDKISVHVLSIPKTNRLSGNSSMARVELVCTVLRDCNMYR